MGGKEGEGRARVGGMRHHGLGVWQGTKREAARERVEGGRGAEGEGRGRGGGYRIGHGRGGMVGDGLMGPDGAACRGEGQGLTGAACVLVVAVRVRRPDNLHTSPETRAHIHARTHADVQQEGRALVAVVHCDKPPDTHKSTRPLTR